MHPRLLAVLVVGLAAGVSLIHLASPYGLHQNDEDLYIALAANMLADGDWLVPHWAGHVSFTKPPMFFWAIASSMSVLGPSVFAARLPVVVAALLGVAATYGFGRRTVGHERAALAALITATTLGFLQFGRAAVMEVPLCLLLVCAAWSTWRAGQGSVSACYGLSLAVTGSVLLKGPAAGLVPIIGAVLWLAVGRRADANAAALPRRHMVVATGLALLLVGAWPLTLHLRGLLGEFHRQFIIGENLGKFNTERDPALRMLGGFLLLLVPWTLLVAAALWTWARDPVLRAAAFPRLLLCFVAANISVYLLPAIKWARYLLPSTPLLALLLVAVAMGSKPDGDNAESDTETGVFAPLPVCRSMRVAAVLTGCMLLLLTPFIAFGARFFSTWETRVELLVLALAVAVTALCLLHGARLFGAAASFAVALMAVSLLTPTLTLDRPPSEIASLAGTQEVMTYNVPATRYALILGRDMQSCATPEEVRALARRGGVLIVGDTELRSLMREGAFDPSRAELLLSWTKWRRGMNPILIIQTVVGGRFEDLTEDVSMMRLR